MSKPLYRPEDWRRTNPGYQRSPPKVCKDGTVWIDGGVCFDLACMGQSKAVIESWNGGPKPLGSAVSARVHVPKTSAADDRVSRVAGERSLPPGESTVASHATAGDVGSEGLL